MIVGDLRGSEETIAAEKRVEGRDHPRGGTVIIGERQDLLGQLDRRTIGPDVGTAETVDRLLRIADHEQEVVARGELRAEERIEDLPLGGIGVLRFVDEAGPVVLLQEATEAEALRGVAQRHLQAADELVEGDHRSVFEATGHITAKVFESRVQFGVRAHYQRLRGGLDRMKFHL